jgi:hypothetical protein
VLERIGSRLWDALVALLAASLDQLLEFPACLLLGGLITRRAQELPLEAPDALFLAGFLLTAGSLARRIVRAPERPLEGYGLWYRTPRGTMGPTTSWAHVPWALVYFWLAHAFWTQYDGEAQRSYLGIGPGFLIVAAGFLSLRAVVRIKRSL